MIEPWTLKFSSWHFEQDEKSRVTFSSQSTYLEAALGERDSGMDVALFGNGESFVDEEVFVTMAYICISLPRLQKRKKMRKIYLFVRCVIRNTRHVVWIADIHSLLMIQEIHWRSGFGSSQFTSSA
jgi:hypothetical protein